MSILSDLQPSKGSTFSKKRIGRGNGSGWGSTATKGNKGQKQRSGGGIPAGFEGGQMPMQRRLPKFGFTNIFATKYSVINLNQLETLAGEVTPETLREAGLVRRTGPVKILGNGTLSKSLTVKAQKFSKSAEEAITKAGGTTEVIK